jgi:hypothetical protein
MKNEIFIFYLNIFPTFVSFPFENSNKYLGDFPKYYLRFRILKFSTNLNKNCTYLTFLIK